MDAIDMYFYRTTKERMDKLCRQVSIESPGPRIQDCVFNYQIPVPEVPPKGARIQVVCAGACYRMRGRSASTSSTTSNHSNDEVPTCNSSLYGFRDSSLFPGFEVAGIVDALGEDVSDTCLKIGQRVIIYPHDDLPHGYAEYMIVPELSYLVPIPDNLPMSVASMLPTGALLAKSAVMAAQVYVEKILSQSPSDHVCKILVVGTGGLALWAVRTGKQQFKVPEFQGRVKIVVASLTDEGFQLASEIPHVSVVQWNEDLFERQIVERTQDACRGLVDVVINFGITSRSLHRCLQCLNSGGIVFVSDEVADRLLPKFSKLIAEKNQKIEPVSLGSIDVLKELVELVSNGEITPPPHTEFAAEDAPTVVKKLCKSEIPGRAVLRFHDIE
ncbi:trans-enoyl reductase fsa3 isoform X2 [Coccinella septempunctata]|uniref:trans-enoyl reductase fsa3 isoform X2 n=1 Tax=Coccinella septempunctata TaxID=41139 RepID=UPI001D097468|nr:trans-enoyl reductase fsa3 isoform X2 [Coccinella septempunctata]